MDTDDAITVTEAAREAGVSVALIRRYAERGTIEAVKVGPRLWLVSRTSLCRWLRERPAPPPAPTAG